MKNTIYICLSVLIAVLTQSCDKLSDELFEKKVSLVKNGWNNLQLEIPQSGVIEIPVSVVVSGTSQNDRNIVVKLTKDSEVLATYNYDKYRDQTELYYDEIPAEAITFPEEVTIESGKEVGTVIVKVDLSKLKNKYADYVLPMKLESTSDYELNKGYGSGLYHIVLTNSFSGDYASADMVVTRVKANGSPDQSDKTSIGNKVLYAVSADECFFYAGKYDRNTKNRDKYVISVKIGEVIDELAASEVLFATPSDSDLDLKYWYNKYDSISSVNFSAVSNPNDNRYVQLTTTFNLSYTFMDVGLSTPIRYRLQGKMSRTKLVLVKKED